MWPMQRCMMYTEHRIGARVGSVLPKGQTSHLPGKRGLVIVCTTPLNPDAGSSIPDFLNGMVTWWNGMVKRLIAKNANGLRLMIVENAIQMVDRRALPKNGIHFNTQQSSQWIKDVFQTKVEEMEAKLRTVATPVNSVYSASTTGGSPRTFGSGKKC